MMEQRVLKDAEQQKGLYDKFRCYCGDNAGQLKQAIEDARVNIPQLQARVKAGEATRTQLLEDLARHKSDRAAAQRAVAMATALREKEAVAYAAALGEQK